MSTDLPALLGGVPIRSARPVWPPVAPWVTEQFQQLAQQGAWGRYHGPHWGALTQALCELHGTEHVQLTCSGSFAVELALRVLRLPAGSEVILSAYDYKPNFTNITHLGLTPVLVDLDPLSAQLDTSRLDEAVTERTGAILVSHLQGSLVDMRCVRQIADAHRIPVIEDACQMLGGMVQGRRAGLWGDLGVLSFGGSKLITSGRGGAILTQREELAQRIKLETQRGNDLYPLSEMQAAMLLPQLQQLATKQDLRQQTVAQFMASSDQWPGLNPFQMVLTDSRPDYYKLGFWYSPPAWQGLSREDFCEALRVEGIPVDPGFRGLHLIHARRRFRAVGDLPIATQGDAEIIAVHHPFLAEPQAVAEWNAALGRIQEHAAQICQRRRPA